MGPEWENMDYERVLIAIWLKGRYLEHLDSFEEADFKLYPHIFKAMHEVGKYDIRFFFEHCCVPSQSLYHFCGIGCTLLLRCRFRCVLCNAFPFLQCICEPQICPATNFFRVLVGPEPLFCV